jgi:amidase
MGAQMQTPARLAVRPLFQLLFGRGAWTRGFTRGLGLSMRRYVAAMTRRDAFIAEMEDFLKDRDAWLCPVASVPAFTHRRKGRRIAVDDRKFSYSVALGSYTSIFNLTGNPAVALPVSRTPEGLPIGAQLIGRRWKDFQLLDTAELIADVTPGFVAPPGY